MSALDLLPDEIRGWVVARDVRLRADLLVIPDAEAAGWVVTFNRDHWHNGTRFHRGAIHVWASHRGWVRTKLAREADGVERFSRDPEAFPYSLADLREALGLPVLP